MVSYVCRSDQDTLADSKVLILQRFRSQTHDEVGYIAILFRPKSFWEHCDSYLSSILAQNKPRPFKSLLSQFNTIRWAFVSLSPLCEPETRPNPIPVNVKHAALNGETRGTGRCWPSRHLFPVGQRSSRKKTKKILGIHLEIEVWG